MYKRENLGLGPMRKLQKKPTRFKTHFLYMREGIRFIRDELLGLRAHKIITKRTLKFSIYYFQFFISLNLAFP